MNWCDNMTIYEMMEKYKNNRTLTKRLKHSLELLQAKSIDHLARGEIIKLQKKKSEKCAESEVIFDGCSILSLM
jgi:hypothetical protein